MKLFVWADPYRVTYGSSAVFAVAETVEEARREAARGNWYSYVEFPHAHGGSADALAAKLGEPTRVVDLPCAEWHEWTE